LELQKEYTDTFFKVRPEYFIFETGAPLAVFDRQPESFKPAFREQLPQIQQALDQDYKRVKKFGATEIYRLNQAASPPLPQNPK
jgi:hypothetical protein